MPHIKIGDRLVGDDQPTFVIAEIGVNHNGILELALELIDAAASAGADAVKFQKRDLKSLYPEKYLANANAGEKTLRYLLPILQKVELPEYAYRQIVARCKERGIIFLCTAWDPVSADFIDSLGVPAFKVASADLTNLPLLEHLAAKGKPLILSTGMSRMEEVETTVQYLKQRGVEFALLHCNSTYPAAFEDINLRFMERLRQFGAPVGYSGHERGIAISTVASALGACIIERHITLDRTMDGPDHASSLEPHGFQKMVRDIRQVASALGTGEEKFMSRGEILNREVLGKSLVSTRRIEPGEEITPDLVTVRSPALGLSPQRYAELIGRVADRVIQANEPFLEQDLGLSIVLDVEHTLPMTWGFTVRFRDFEELLPYEPRMLEFHFTDHDIDEPYAGGDFDLELVVHAPEFWDRTLVDLCAQDPLQRSRSVQLMQRTIDRTRELAPHFRGTPKVVVHPGAMSLDHPLADRHPLYDNLRQSVQALDHDGVELLLENLPPHPWYFGGQWLTNAFMDAYEIRDFIDAMNLNICFDASHAKLYCNWAHKDFYNQVRVLLPYIRHLHLADAAGLDGEGLQIGEGTIDWVHFFQVIDGYQGTMIPAGARVSGSQSSGCPKPISRHSDPAKRSSLKSPEAISRLVRERQADWLNNRRLSRLTRAVVDRARPNPTAQPVVVFRASTGLLRLSLNAAFSLLTGWALRLSGTPVIHFVCQTGMSRCVQGLNREDFSEPPPCQACMAQARRTYAGAPVRGFSYQEDPGLAKELRHLSLDELAQIEHDGLPLGEIVLPAARWILRRHHLADDEPTRFLFREFVLSAHRVAHEFSRLLDDTKPQAVVVFNGLFFPEAIARHVARQRGLRVITHEVGMLPFSAFFTEGQATAYPMDIPADFEITVGQEGRLNRYLEQRFQGEFTMAGIRFWPEIQGLDEDLLARADRFGQLVSVFTNVVFDTSQVHANIVFPHMFAWLDLVAELIRTHPDTLFVIRAHPDELRLNKESQESVADWVRRRGLEQLPNVVFIDADQYLSSYELIQRSKFVLVYNSSIGLEAALLGARVICGGTARYTPYPIAELPESPDDFRNRVEDLLNRPAVMPDPEAIRHARRFLYYQLFRASLPLDRYLEPHPRPGFVTLRDFSVHELQPARSPALHAIVDGITRRQPFLLEEQVEAAHNEGAG